VPKGLKRRSMHQRIWSDPFSMPPKETALTVLSDIIAKQTNDEGSNALIKGKLPARKSSKKKSTLEEEIQWRDV
jgi:hypothetical protein